MSWLSNNQTLIGCIVIGVGTIIVALSSILKSKGDRATASRKKEENSRSGKFYFWFVFVLVVGFGFNVCGTWLTKRAGEDASRKQNENAERILRETKADGFRMLKEAKEDNARVKREFREKFQAVLTKLNAAKQEDSKRITDEKIRVIQTDFSSWAEAFATNLPSRRNEFAQLKADFQKAQIEKTNKEIQRQVQLSGQAYPVLSFAVRFLEESVRAYATRTGRTNQVRVVPMVLPENFFEKPTTSEIQLGTNAVWKLSVTTVGRLPNLPFNPEKLPYVKITFINSHGQQSALFGLLPKPEEKKMWLSYSAG